MSQYPDVYAALDDDVLLNAFHEGPRRFRAVVSGLEESQLRAHPIPGKWSIFEIVLHVADSELMGAARFRLALAETGSDAPMYDQDVWAQKLAYGDASAEALGEALDLFEALTKTTGRFLEQLPADGWRRWVRHSDWGEMTLRQLLELYADHRERHIEQILERRSLLGVPLSFPILLERRLY